MIKKIASFFLILLIIACEKNNELVEMQKLFLKTNHTFNFTIDKESINFSIGIWLFKEKDASINGIAKWINVQHLGKTILEPINVVWVDLKATNSTEAINNIENYLEQNNFLMRSGSSIGYFGLFDASKWIPQHQETWSDKKNPNTVNNHGRIFLAHQIENDSGKSFFVSTGAFSVETETHLFISFKDALKQFNATNNWYILENNKKIGNTLHTDTISTFDHEGVKVIVLK